MKDTKGQPMSESDVEQRLELELQAALQAYDRVVLEHTQWDKNRIAEMDELRRKLVETTRERDAFEKMIDELPAKTLEAAAVKAAIYCQEQAEQRAETAESALVTAREEIRELKRHFDAVMQNTQGFREAAEQRVADLEIALDKFDDAIGTSWDCECGRTEYNDSPECQECGRERPSVNAAMHAARALLGKEQGR